MASLEAERRANTPLARRNRDILKRQRQAMKSEQDSREKRLDDEIDNTIDEGFSKHFANKGTRAGKTTRGFGESRLSHGRHLWDD